MEETIALIKSCIISNGGSLPIKSLNYEFKQTVGEPIPYERLGFHSLSSLLREVDGLKTITGVYGDKILTVNDPKVNHIAELIKKQKNNYKRTCSKYYKRFVPYNNDIFNDNDNRNSNNKLCKNRNKIWYNDNQKFVQSRNVTQCSNRTLNSTNTDRTKSTRLSSDEKYEENNDVVIIETGISKEEKIIYDPIVHRNQLIGDDFFLQLVIRNLGLPVWRQAGDMALHCGLCISGQTIQDCIDKLNTVECISNRIVIMLGAVDVYNGASFEDLVQGMTWLLKLLEYKFSFSRSAITICTIPPLANLSLYGHSCKIRALYSFNTWIRHLANIEGHGFGKETKSYRVIDFFEVFTDNTYTTQYDYFQLNARMVSGCKHPYVLWNKQGRQLAMETLHNEL